MQPITKTVYAAFDGTSFDTAAECKAYERSFAHLAIVGLTVEQALAIVTREDAERAELVEHIGKQIERKRLEAGEFKRRPSEAKAPEAEAEPEKPEAGTIPITPAGQPWGGAWPSASKPDATDDSGNEADALTA